MSIQWFPGHMHKARKEMARVLPTIDLIIEVLDARIPWSSENPLLGELAQDKPVLRLLNKSDLADSEVTQLWQSHLSAQPKREALAVSSKDPQTAKTLVKTLQTLLPSHTKTSFKPQVAMIVGIPNVGKSTIINQLAGRQIAATGNEPAITKRQQLIKLNDNWGLRDTPGVLWPKVENPLSGYRLAATGAVRDTAMDSAEVACYLLDHLRNCYQALIKQRYGDNAPLADSIALLEHLGRLRGCLSSGSQVDFDRAGRLLLQEFRSGTLGRISLETPAMSLVETVETEERRIAQAQKKALRKKKAKRRK